MTYAAAGPKRTHHADLHLHTSLPLGATGVSVEMIRVWRVEGRQLVEHPLYPDGYWVYVYLRASDQNQHAGQFRCWDEHCATNRAQSFLALEALGRPYADAVPAASVGCNCTGVWNNH